MSDTITETEVEDLVVEDPTDIDVEETDLEETEVEVDEDSDSFPREYVEKLRRENARYRERAGQASDLAGRLHAALVAATGRLADPSDLAFDEAHLDDGSALSAALDDLRTASRTWHPAVCAATSVKVSEAPAHPPIWPASSGHEPEGEPTVATKVNHDKIAETAEVILDEIRKCAENYTSPADLHELAQGFAAVVEASPNGWSDTGRKVTVR